jgi:BirA family biotin operon repressor/biotin-[acetyl-CoA-carboxylase] ligase
VNHTNFPVELTDEATSLRLHAGRQFEREEILHALLAAVDTFTEMDGEAILRLFTHASSYAIGRRVIVHQPDGIVEGVTAGLDTTGYLIVRKDDGTDTLILAGGVRAARS